MRLEDSWGGRSQDPDEEEIDGVLSSSGVEEQINKSMRRRGAKRKKLGSAFKCFDWFERGFPGPDDLSTERERAPTRAVR